MKRKFITYGSNAFKQSSKRIIEEAKALNIFDETYRYEFEDLPLSIQASPLFLDKKKGGHWLWKAYIIYDSLLKLKDNDILVYVDCGSELYNSDLWIKEFKLLEESSALFYQYRSDVDYGWKKFNPLLTNSPKIKHWIKDSTKDYFTEIFSDNYWVEENKIWAGFMILKRDKITLEIIKNWLEIMLYKPELVIDPLLPELPQNKEFVAQRYDQSILSAIVRYYEHIGSAIKILDEKSELNYTDQIVKASRRVDKIANNTFKDKLKALYYKIRK